MLWQESECVMRFFVVDGLDEDGDLLREGGVIARRKAGWHDSLPHKAAPTSGDGSRWNGHSKGRSKLRPTEFGAIMAV